MSQSKKGFKIVIESDNVVAYKNGIFVEKGYDCDGMFKLSITAINNIYAYRLSLIICYGMLN